MPGTIIVIETMTRRVTMVLIYWDDTDSCCIGCQDNGTTRRLMLRSMNICLTNTSWTWKFIGADVVATSGPRRGLIAQDLLLEWLLVRLWSLCHAKLLHLLGIAKNMHDIVVICLHTVTNLLKTMFLWHTPYCLWLLFSSVNYWRKVAKHQYISFHQQQNASLVHYIF